MVPINVAADTVYLNNTRIWVGMTERDSIEIQEAFNFADKDNNKVIDENEMRRYNDYMSAAQKGQVVTIRGVEFYTGQKTEDIGGDGLDLVYKDLDSNSDGELSSKEIQEYQDYVERKNEYQKKYDAIVKENSVQKSDNADTRFGVGALGAIGGFFATKKVCDVLTGKMIDSPNKLVRVGAALPFLGMIGVMVLAIKGATVLADKYVNTKIIPPEEQLKEEIEALKPLDEKYKHIYVS